MHRLSTIKFWLLLTKNFFRRAYYSFRYNIFFDDAHNRGTLLPTTGESLFVKVTQKGEYLDIEQKRSGRLIRMIPSKHSSGYMVEFHENGEVVYRGQMSFEEIWSRNNENILPKNDLEKFDSFLTELASLKKVGIRRKMIVLNKFLNDFPNKAEIKKVENRKIKIVALDPTGVEEGASQEVDYAYVGYDNPPELDPRNNEPFGYEPMKKVRYLLKIGSYEYIVSRDGEIIDYITGPNRLNISSL